MAPLLALTLSAVMAAPAWASTVGSGRTATETRAVEGFEAVSLRGSIDLEVRQAALASAAVTADDNLLPLLETVVEDGTLQVRFRRGESVRTQTPTKVVVTTPKLTAVSSAGSGDALVDGLQTPVFKLSIAGSSETVLRRLQTDALEITIAGSSDVSYRGNPTSVKSSVMGSGSLEKR